MAKVSYIDGQPLIDLFKAMSIEDWRAVHDVQVSITPPGTVTVVRLLRNEDGRFYKDPETDDAAAETHIAHIKWPTDAH